MSLSTKDAKSLMDAIEKFAKVIEDEVEDKQHSANVILRACRELKQMLVYYRRVDKESK